MGKFFAWAASGIVTGLEIWPQDQADRKSSRNRGHRSGSSGSERNSIRFFLLQQDGREIEILLSPTPMDIRNGQALTAVWAAKAKAPYGHCIFLENQSTGAIARIIQNLRFIRQATSRWKMALIGLLAPLPFIVGIVAWLASLRTDGYDQSFFISATSATALLLIIGFVSAKLTFDYIKAEEERQIWIAADKALIQVRTLLINRSRAAQKV